MTGPHPRPRILCVDDEQHILDALKRTLRNDYDVTPALGGAVALGMLTNPNSEPFDVIVSDMRMPEIDGITLLARAAEATPDTVRVLLTGQADLSTALDAVNKCGIYRFLLKPADHESLTAALDAAVAQHQLIVSERELLEQTLRGAVAALLEALSLANPTAFARANRVRRIVTALLPAVDAPDGWSIEVAATLAQVGAVALPADVATKLDQGLSLSPDEQELADRIPSLTEQLLGTIPRLELIRNIIRLQTKNFDGSGAPGGRVSGEDIPLGARLLKVAVELDQLESMGFGRAQALGAMVERHGRYDPRLLRALQSFSELESLSSSMVPRDVTTHELQPGMIVARDITDTNGILLVGRGHEVTASMIARLTNNADRIALPIWVTGGSDATEEVIPGPAEIDHAS